MTMYLPNGEVRPTGFEAGEFLDSPPLPAVEPPEEPEGEDDSQEPA